MRPISATALGLFGALMAAWTTEPAAAAELTLLGEYRLPPGLQIAGAPLGGFTAIDYDPERDVYYLLSDDPAERGPARYYELAIGLGAEGISGVDIRRSVTLRTQSGLPFPEGGVHPAALRRAAANGPDAGALYWAHGADAEGLPFAGVLDRGGRTLAGFSLPAYYLPEGAGAARRERGVRPGFGVEGVTVTAEGRVVLALGQALIQDGEPASLGAGSPARMLVIDPNDGLPEAEYLYVTEPVAARPSPGDGAAYNGLADLLATPDGRFYALERSASAGQSPIIRLFETGFDGAGNLLGVERLAQASIEPMRKTPLLTLQAGGALARVGAVEGMTFGPDIDGKRTLVLISDDDFASDGLGTQILAFAIEE